MLRASKRMQLNFLNIVLAFLLAYGSMGCEKKEEQELKLLCGNSFLKPAEQLCKEFTEKTGIQVVLTTGGSEDLLPQVEVKTIGDIFITHDPYLDYSKQAEAVADSAQVGYVAPVLAVQKGNPQGLTKIEDLTKPGLKVAFSNPEYSTCGEMVFALLEEKGIKDAVMKNVGNRLTKGHPKLCTFLQTQTVDAVITWNGVAHTFRDHLEIVPTPYEYAIERRVHVIGLNYSKHPEWVKQFVDFARIRGKEIFTEYGYVK